MLKAEIRKLFLQKRQQIDKPDLQTLSQKIADRFFKFLPDYIFTIHIYLPIEEKGEINTWPIIRKFWEMELNTVAPVMDVKRTSISSWVLTPEIKLEKNIWGVPEPVGAEIAVNSVIQLVVVPLLAFDERGYRVGYGKGFYDRFLASFQEQPIKVGLSLFDPIDKISDLNNQDIPLDFCITPGQVFQFKATSLSF